MDNAHKSPQNLLDKSAPLANLAYQMLTYLIIYLVMTLIAWIVLFLADTSGSEKRKLTILHLILIPLTGFAWPLIVIGMVMVSIIKLTGINEDYVIWPRPKPKQPTL